LREKQHDFEKYNKIANPNIYLPVPIGKC